MKTKFKHPNAIQFFNDNKLEGFLALPPTDKDYSIDIVNINQEQCKNYTLNFSGYILRTTPKYRKLYQCGKLIAKIKR